MGHQPLVGFGGPVDRHGKVLLAAGGERRPWLALRLDAAAGALAARRDLLRTHLARDRPGTPQSW
jgi:hypothetical protein